MTTKKTSVAQKQPSIHARGAHYDDLCKWKAFTDNCLETFAAMMVANITGEAERRIHGSASIAYDRKTARIITESIEAIRQAVSGSEAVWLPGVKEAQMLLPAARKDERFQSFLKEISSTDKQGRSS